MPEFLEEKEKKILELDSRRKIYSVVRQFAGSHFREIERKSGLSTGSVRHHLSYLAKHGLIKEEKESNNLRYFPRDFKPSNKKLMGFLRQESMRRILVFILSHESCNNEQISSFSSLSPSTVSWHLKKLEENNIISSSRKGRKSHYLILADKNEIINLLITYRESFLDSLVDNIVEMWDV